MAANPREELIAYLAKLSDQEVIRVLEIVEALYKLDVPSRGTDSEFSNDTADTPNRPPEYAQYDPTVGMVSGVIDGARRIREIAEETVVEKFASRGKPLKKD